jgi:NAD+ dependent glucose-6-phosphate dehydrogenase
VIKKVGITGAGGKIGKVLTEGLVDKYQLTLFYRNTRPDSFQDLKTVQVDLSDGKQVKGIFQGLDAVIHLAAASQTSATWEMVLEQNIIATYNVYEEARKAGVSKIVFASTNHTQHAYTMGATPMLEDLSRAQKHGLIKLDDQPAPDSLYGVSKLFGEDLGRYYSTFYGIKFIALRIGWTCFSGLIPEVVKTGVSNMDHLRVMFLSKRDLIEATERALQIDTDFLIAYAVSDNKPAIFDLTETRNKLGFNPKDNSQTFLNNNLNSDSQ